MAAGVGKTYRALQDLRAAADAGRDAVVAYLEPHGRAETVMQAQGLEVLPRRTVTHRGVTLAELDVPGVLRRNPELALVDELAHTNAPGLEHAQRWRDVEQMLASGIDVISTVNVQHLESLNDVVLEITGVRVRETIPDRLLTEADEVVVVDVVPQALLERLRSGRVYPSDRVEAALNGFFKVEHLAALRELTLRRAAETVETGRRRDAPPGTAEPGAKDVGEHLLAWIPDVAQAGDVLVRRAARSATRLGAPLTVLVTRPVRPPSDGEQQRIDALSRLCSVLRVELAVRESDDPLATLVATARALDVTYLLLLPPRQRRFQASVVERVLKALPDVDLRLVRGA